jgi:hypothetical protein
MSNVTGEKEVMRTKSFFNLIVSSRVWSVVWFGLFSVVE